MSHAPSAQPNGLASTSSAPHIATPASYHPLPRPQPLPPLVRVDTQAIKQELHDALGENGLAYWKAVNGYLVGQLSRRELEGMVRGWLKGDKLPLHNKLLISLLHNASTPSQAPPSALLGRKRKRVPAHDPDFDIDEAHIEPKLRIAQWVGSLTQRDRGRLRRAMNKAAEEEAAAAAGTTSAAGADGAAGGTAGGTDKPPEDPEAYRRKSTFTPNITLPSISMPDRALPSSSALLSRLQAIAAANDLRLPSDPEDVGEFLSLGLDSHLSEILHGLVHLTGRERPGNESIRIPLAHQSYPTPESYDGDDGDEAEGSGAGRKPSLHASPDLPQPDVQTLHHLLTLQPGVHPHPSPAIYQLRTNHTLGQIDAHRSLHSSSPRQSQPPTPSLAHMPRPTGTGTANPIPPLGAVPSAGPSRLHAQNPTPPDSPSRPIVPMHLPSSTGFTSGGGIGGSYAQRVEAVGRNLLESGLLKIEVPDKGEEDPAGGVGAGVKGKKKKHGLHWKYEDPAFILRDILG